MEAFETQVQKQSHPVTQRCSFSSYKWRNTLKVPVGVAPDGALFLFRAPSMADMDISDIDLVRGLRLGETLVPGDHLMVNHGFQLTNKIEVLYMV